MQDIIDQVRPVIREYGFKGSGQNYRKIINNIVMVINFQKGSPTNRFYINLGVHPLNVPFIADTKNDPNKHKEHECFFRTRIDPPSGFLGWPIPLDTVNEEKLITDLRNCFTEYFDHFESLIDDFMTLENEAVEKKYLEYLGKNGRGYYILALICQEVGNKEDAIKFANKGLDITKPIAKSLIGSLKKIIKR